MWNDSSHSHTLPCLKSTILCIVVTIKDDIIVTKDSAVTRLSVSLVVEVISSVDNVIAVINECKRLDVTLFCIKRIHHIDELIDWKNSYVLIPRSGVRLIGTLF